MINPQLLNYVRAQRQAGVPKEEIIKALSGGGWSAADAQDAFAAIEGVQVPPVAPKPVPPPMTTPAPAPVVSQPRPVQPVVQPVVQQPMAQPVMSSRIQPAAVVQRQPVYAQVKRRSVAPWIFMLFLFLIIGFAAGAYMAVAYPFVHDTVMEFKNMISPPTLEPVTEENTENATDLPSFMPTFPPLGSGTATTTGATTTASTTAN